VVKGDSLMQREAGGGGDYATGVSTDRMTNLLGMESLKNGESR
jgi:hypothetical protein